MFAHKKSVLFKCNNSRIFHDCQIIIFILKLLHDKKKEKRKNEIVFRATANATLLAVISRCYLFSFHRMLKFCRTILFSKIVFCLLVGWLVGRSKDGTKVYFKYIITIFWYRQLCEHWTLNSHQAEIEKLFSMLLFRTKKKSKKKRRIRGKKSRRMNQKLKKFCYTLWNVIFLQFKSSHLGMLQSHDSTAQHTDIH